MFYNVIISLFRFLTSHVSQHCNFAPVLCQTPLASVRLVYIFNVGFYVRIFMRLLFYIG